MKWLHDPRMGLASVVLCLFTIGFKATAQEGRIITETVHSPSLEGNLFGDSPDRPVTIYLPPSYETQTGKFYPVVYLLHGFGDDHNVWIHGNDLFDPGNILNYMQSWLAQGRVKEMIIVMPNSHNRFGGSWYSNSSATGNWADYITRDLVDYIDRHYRSLPQRDSRAVVGHSMGGYGGMTLGLDYPDVFGCMGSISGLLDMAQYPVVISWAFADGAKLKNLSTFAAQDFNVQVAIAMSAAIAANADNPPLYADFPWERDDSGQLVQKQAVWNKFLERDVLRRLSKNVEALRSMRAIYVDCGTSDPFNFIADARRVHDELQRLNIPHHYHEFAGGHVTHFMASTGEALELFSSTMAFEMLPRELATNPTPANTADDVPTDTDLAWTPGEHAAAHNVYFGSSWEDVNAADPATLIAEGLGRDESRLAVGPLDYGRTYYWRVVEVNVPPDNSVYGRSLWSFTTEPYAYPLTSVTATASSAQPGMGPGRTVDGSGLDENDGHSTDQTDMWWSMAEPSHWIQYEFDRVYTLRELWVWNFNLPIEPFVGFGAKTVKIEYSTDGTTWTVLADVPEFAQAPGQPGYTPNTIVSFAGVPARFVKLTIENNWGMAQQTGLSEVRFFHIPLSARAPQPAVGAIDVGLDVELNWRPGREAELHEVYIGTDPDALVLVGTVPDHSYTPGPLAPGTTYYWRIDEIGGAGPYEGEVWSFTTSGLTP
jgi:S-formylglutathione hydrolase